MSNCVICLEISTFSTVCCKQVMCLQCLFNLEKKQCSACRCEPLQITDSNGKIINVPNTRGYVQPDLDPDDGWHTDTDTESESEYDYDQRICDHCGFECCLYDLRYTELPGYNKKLCVSCVDKIDEHLDSLSDLYNDVLRQKWIINNTEHTKVNNYYKKEDNKEMDCAEFLKTFFNHTINRYDKNGTLEIIKTINSVYNQCNANYLSGEKKGQRCCKESKSGTFFCGLHYARLFNKHYPVLNKDQVAELKSFCMRTGY